MEPNPPQHQKHQETPTQSVHTTSPIPTSPLEHLDLAITVLRNKQEAARAEIQRLLSLEAEEADIARQLEALTQARRIDVPSEVLLREVSQYNAAVQDDSRFNPAILDGSSADGIDPPRSNYAARIVNAPFFAFEVFGGITFTFGGVRIDTRCRVVRKDGSPIPGLFATGEMAGGFFARTYPANAGLARGAVTGLISGESAANFIQGGSR
jgi:tricarballylate dehydrogenase